MSAYFDDFEATALHMRHGWYDTGDMGYRDEDGYLWHVGRLGRFLKVGGEMVSLVQVEDALQRALPEAVECGVVEVPDAVRGARIVAAVTQNVDEKAATAKLAESLPRIAAAETVHRPAVPAEDAQRQGGLPRADRTGARHGAGRESGLTRVSRF